MKWRVLVRMIGFINSLVTHSFNYTQIHWQYSAIADIHVFQFTIAHALGFSVSISRLLATDLHTKTVTSVATSITPKIFQLHFQYHSTTAHIKSSIHTIHLHWQTSCIPPYSWFQFTPSAYDWLENAAAFPSKLPTTHCLGHPRCLQDNPSAWTTEKTHFPILLRRSVYWTIAQQRL
jgi:hypothetical protein